MSDIIVSFDDAQGGFGDILFAAKLAYEIKQKMISEGTLVGNVYMVANGGNRFCEKLEISKADIEFGINFLTNIQANALLRQNALNPAVIIEAPTPATIPFQHSSAMIVSAREYSYGPFKVSKVGTSFAKANPDVQKQYELGLKSDEDSRLKKYQGNARKETIRSGLIEELNEGGVILTDDLVALSKLRQSNDQVALGNAKELQLASLPNPMKSLILQNNLSLREYEQNNELTFGYSHKSNTDFLQVHSGWIKSSDKNQDLFLSSSEDKGKIQNSLDKMKNELIIQGFTKITYKDYDTGEEKVLHDSGTEGKTYRLIHTFKGIPHQQVVALEAISGPLTLASGDQSFGEAISADKVICYETYVHKALLYSAYEERAQALSPATQQQLSLLRLEPDDINIQKKKIDFAKLGAELRGNKKVCDEISAINHGIIDKNSLGNTFVQKISPAIPELKGDLEKAIINNEPIKDHMLANIEYPKHLFLAIRYKNQGAVEQILKQNPHCLIQRDELGNNAFIVATQEREYETLKLLVAKASAAGIPFSEINEKNNHFAEYRMTDYLPPLITNNKPIQNDIFGNYSSDVEKQLKAKAPVVVTPKPVSVTSVGMFAPPKAAPVNIWHELSTKLMEANASIADEAELQQQFKPFLIVTREYLKNRPAFVNEFNEVDGACKEMGIDDNWSFQHVDEYKTMKASVGSFISSDSNLSTTIGEKWIPDPPKSLWEHVSDRFATIMETADEATAMKEISKYVVVLHELFKDHPEHLGGFDEMKKMMRDDLGIGDDWVESNQQEYAELLKAVCEEFDAVPELSKFGVDWAEAARGSALAPK